MKAIRGLGAGAAILWCVQGSAAQGATLYTSCEQVLGEESEKVVCQVRTTTGASLTGVKATLSDGREPRQEVQAYGWTTNSSAFYFLVQSSAVTREQMQRIGEFLERAAYPVGKQSIGVATAGTALKEEAPLGSYRLNLVSLARSLAELTPLEGASVVLASVDEAIDKVAAATAERKAVVILSGASPSASGLDEARVTALARDKKVALYVVTFGDKGETPAPALARLAADTYGSRLDLAGLPRAAILELASHFSKLLENGVVLTLDTEGLPQSSEFTVTASVDGKGEMISDPIRIDRLTEDPWYVMSGDFVSGNLMAILAVLGLGAGLVLIAASQGARARAALVTVPARALDRIATTATRSSMARSALDALKLGSFLRRPAAAPAAAGMPEPETQILVRSEPGAGEPEAQAWLELVDGNAPPVPLHAGSARIGRSAENDIRLTNRSVHRHHAMLQMSADGTFSIHDLGTRNGVFVNGTRYTRRDLAHGDVIELGEVKLRFVGERPAA